MWYALPIQNCPHGCIDIFNGEEPFPEGAIYPLEDWVIKDCLEAKLVDGEITHRTEEEKLEIIQELREIQFQENKPYMLKIIENLYVEFLTVDWTNTLRGYGIIPPSYTITVDNTDEATNIGMLIYLKNIDKTVYYNMAGEFDRYKTTITSYGGTMGRVAYHDMDNSSSSYSSQSSLSSESDLSSESSISS